MQSACLKGARKRHRARGYESVAFRWLTGRTATSEKGSTCASSNAVIAINSDPSVCWYPGHKSVGRRARLHARSRAASQNVLQGCQRASCSAGSAIDHAQADEALEPSRSPCEAGPGQKDRYQRRRVRLQGDAQGTFADVRCRDRGHSCSNSKWRLMACLGLKFLVFMGLGF
jgi:hypothetical protein